MTADDSRSRALRFDMAVGVGALFVAMFFLAASVDAQPAQKTQSAKATSKKVTAPTPVLEPKAIEILKAACARLSAARTMSFMAVASYESPSRLGPALVFTTSRKSCCSDPTSSA